MTSSTIRPSETRLSRKVVPHDGLMVWQRSSSRRLMVARIQRDVIARGVFTSVKDLDRKLMRYIRQHNRSVSIDRASSVLGLPAAFGNLSRQHATRRSTARRSAARTRP